MVRLLLPNLVGDTGIAEWDDGATAAGDCRLPPTPLYKTAADERYLGVREGWERKNRIIRACTRLADRGSAKMAW